MLEAADWIHTLPQDEGYKKMPGRNGENLNKNAVFNVLLEILCSLVIYIFWELITSLRKKSSLVGFYFF